jgi:prophage regulatory protein
MPANGPSGSLTRTEWARTQTRQRAAGESEDSQAEFNSVRQSLDDTNEHVATISSSEVWEPRQTKVKNREVLCPLGIPVMTPEFFLPAEVQAITRLRDPTRKRMENRGLFPRRIRIAPRRVAWRKTDIEAWAADPEGWGKRNDASATGR